jgi:predicted permease
VLVVGAGLLMRTFVGLMVAKLGYTATNDALAFHVNLPWARYQGVESRLGLLESLIARIRSMPDVRAVGYTGVSPWNGGLMSVGLRIEGRTDDDVTAPRVEYATASDDFLKATGIPLRAGRTFTPTDRRGSPNVLVVSESVARRNWPGATPIGARVRLTDAIDSSAVLEVIGVVGDVRPNLTDDPIATIYVSERQWTGFGGEFVVRTSGNAMALVPSITRVLRELDPNLPLIHPRTLRRVIEEAASRQQLAMRLMGAFAGLALLLSALGVYSVMAYEVAARTREFGIRAALGARRTKILALVFRDGLSTTIIGVAAGLLAAALASKLIASLLVGVSTHDALTFALAPAVLIIVATLACLLPAVTATRVAPVDALRAD